MKHLFTFATIFIFYTSLIPQTAAQKFTPIYSARFMQSTNATSNSDGCGSIERFDLGINMGVGTMLKSFLYAGINTGYARFEIIKWANCRDEVALDKYTEINNYIPVYADLKLLYPFKYVRPFISLDLGCDFISGNFSSTTASFSGLNIGLDINIHKRYGIFGSLGIRKSSEYIKFNYTIGIKF